MTDAFAPDLLSGKTAFITGGTSGINLAIAARFVRAGAAVTVLGRNPEKAAAARVHLAGLRDGARVRAATADVRDFAALDAAIGSSVTEHGPLDILVCGAAGNFSAPAAALSPNGFKAVIDIDLGGSFHAVRSAFVHLRKPGASVMFISATQAFMPAVAQAHACAAKAGIDMMMKVLALEWGGAGVRVNSIAPGPIGDTEGMRKLASTPEARARAEKNVPLGRFGTSDEVADLALFLASPAAAYVHGAVLCIDGGFGLVGFGMNPLG